MIRPRILLLGDTLAIGGTEGQFVEVALRLPRERWDVRVACLRAEGPLRARLDTSGVPVSSLAGGPARAFGDAGRILALARRLRRERVALVHTFDYYSNVRGVLAARLARTRVIASQRDLGNLRPERQEGRQRLALRLADRVLVNSPAAANVVAHAARVRPERIALVPNGLDVVRFCPAPGPRSTDQVMVGTLANLRPEKGVVELVEAAALLRDRCPEMRLILWGDGPLRPALERRIVELGLGGIVALRGRTDSPETALRELDIFVLASTSEAQSNALLEAMATGLSVVATAVGGNPWTVEDERSGLLVPPDDPPALAKAIGRLVEDYTLRQEFGVRGRERARLEFAMDRMLTRLEALYGQVLDTSR
jgi:L-malate glycosyltransferase